MDLKNHYTVTQVNNRARTRLVDWTSQSCTPDWDTCEEICDPHELVDCGGVIKNGVCREVAMCDHFSDFRIPFLEFLTI
jgi:hypothetical protein